MGTISKMNITTITISFTQQIKHSNAVWEFHYRLLEKQTEFFRIGHLRVTCIFLAWPTSCMNQKVKEQLRGPADHHRAPQVTRTGQEPAMGGQGTDRQKTKHPGGSDPLVKVWLHPLS